MALVDLRNLRLEHYKRSIAPLHHAKPTRQQRGAISLKSELRRNSLNMTTNSNQPQEANVQVDVLSALLDFYSDRATGFASLFVASVFGLVTLAAIIRTYSGNSLWYYIAGIPYFAFVLSGLYTWSKFCSWADIANKIERQGFREHHRPEIERITFKIWIGKEEYDTNLYDFIQDACTEQKHQPVKKLLDLRSYSFTVLYLILIVGLTIITYWNFLISHLFNPFFIVAVVVFISVSVYLGCRHRKAKKKRIEDRVKKLVEQQQKANKKNESESK